MSYSVFAVESIQKAAIELPPSELTELRPVYFSDNRDLDML